jgi:hypothetical protein
MIGLARNALDVFFGRGESSLTVPVMDGPFSPNELLDEAPVVFSTQHIDNLLASGDAMFASAGRSVVRFALQQDVFTAELVQDYSSTVTCLAAGPDGGLAIGREDGKVEIRGGPFDGRNIGEDGTASFGCPVALLFDGDAHVIIANGSARLPASQWRRDLMSLGRTGSVWRVGLESGIREALATGLSFPYGLATDDHGKVYVSESWKHRVIALDRDGRASSEIIISHLPGYPSRLTPAAAGGFWLSIFAPRNQLVEFILREHRYRQRMLAEVPEEEWMAPVLASGMSVYEPLQWSAIRQMGILKPWAAWRSYGLLVNLDADLVPRYSYHSRADGAVHGVTSACEYDQSVFVCAKGSGKIVRLPNQAGVAKARQ